jgi:hypothetical protein
MIINIININPKVVIANKEIQITLPLPSSKSVLPNCNTIESITVPNKKVNKKLVKHGLIFYEFYEHLLGFQT